MMKTQRAPGWQLDLFLLAMIALLIGSMTLPVLSALRVTPVQQRFLETLD